jgi:hypothetical protein
MGIRATFATVTFKKDGEELFSTKVTDGGCFGPNPDLDVINGGFNALNRAIDDGQAKTAALAFNKVAITSESGRTREYSVGKHTATHIDAEVLKHITP